MPTAFDFVDNDITSVASAGAGDVTLGSAAKSGHRLFSSVLSNSDMVIVTFYLETPNDNVNDWEISECTYTSAGTLLSRDTVLASSNSDALITLTSTHRATMDITAFIGSKIHFEATAGSIRLGLDCGNDSMTGIDNALAGSGAAVNLTSGQENAVFGKDAGTGLTATSLCSYFGKDAGKGATGTQNSIVGKDALGGAGNSTGANNSGIGAFAMDAATSADGVAFVGQNAFGALTSGRRGVAMGSQAGDLMTTGSFGIFIGHRTNGTSSANYQIAMGYRATAAGANSGVLGSQFSGAEVTTWYWNGHDSSAPVDTVITGASASGTDVAGGDHILAGGIGTGSGAGGQVKFQTAAAGGSGSTQNTLTDRGYVDEDGGLVWGSPAGASQGAGTINATGVYDDGVLLTDYVFEKYFDGEVIDAKHSDYEVKSLEDEIKHVKENKHLSTIIGRKEWEEKGNSSMGELISQLWETIETQFIYISQLEERISKLERG